MPLFAIRGAPRPGLSISHLTEIILLVSFLASCLEKDKDSSSSSAEKEAAIVVQKTLEKIEHASLQAEDMPWLKKQMPNGSGPVFSIWLKSAGLAKCLPSKLRLFHHATSLGGVESLIEWRRMSDRGVEDTLCRVSVGVENWEDLRDDLVQGLKALLEMA